MIPRLSKIDHLVLTVGDIDATVEFYEHVLGMCKETFQATDGSSRIALNFGAQKINLHPLGGEYEPKAMSATPGSADLCFISDTQLADWQDHFRIRGVQVESGPVTRTGATGAINSIYTRDPDGNLIEISNQV